MKKLQINWTLWIQGLIFIAVATMVFNIVMNLGGIFSWIGTFLGVISPVIMAAVIAYILSRPARGFQNLMSKSKYKFVRKRARGLAVLTVYLMLVLLIYITLSLLFPLLIGNIVDFIDFVPELYYEVETFVTDIQWDSFDEMFNLQETIDEFFADFDAGTVIEPITQGLGAITNVAISTALWIFDFLLAVIISIYMLLYKDVIFAAIDRISKLIIKAKSLSTLKYYFKQADDLFYKFIGAQFLDSCIMGAMSIVLLVALNVRFAVFLGIILGIANMIPKFGSIFASVFVIILTFITGSFNQGVLTLVLLTIVQQIDGNIIGPMIMGDALKINPILVFIALILGAAYFGIIGMFLSIPVVALIKIITVNVIEAKEKKRTHADQIIDCQNSTV